ncbi:MAG: DUF2125 domain-containing protein [Alphaproteobacteria bacterium]
MVAQVQMEAGANIAPRPRKRRRRLVPLVLSVPIFLALGWAAYWYAAYYLVDGHVVDSPGAASLGELTVICAERQIGGFPLRISVRCVDAFTEAENGIRFGVAGFDAEAPLYNPGWVEASANGPLTFEGVNHRIDADWTAARGDLLAGLGGVDRGAATFVDVQLDVSDFVDDVVWGATADVWMAEVQAAGQADALRVVLATSNLMIEIGGRVYPSLSGTATLTVIDSGGRFNRLPSVMIGDWLVAGGAFQVEHMALSSGNLNAEITGDGVLEVDGTLTGNVTLRYSGEEDLPQFVSAIFPWLEDEADIIAQAIAALSQQIEMRGESAYEVRLILNHGAVRIGFIPIPLTIPSIGPLDQFLPEPA